jgi:hypothetical protein
VTERLSTDRRPGARYQRHRKFQLRCFFEGEIVIRPVRDDELAAVLRLWQAAGVTPPSISDSIALAALRTGDWAQFGTEMQQLGTELGQPADSAHH